MKNIDALGPRPDRHHAFTRELLAETGDAELQSLVEQAAKELSAPIALVTLVLDQIQFFKAHCGLPQDLAAARGTRRDASFCQFVVRDGEVVEITDARNNPELPQHVVDEYDIQAYLGIPIHSDDVVLGSLCVLDTKPRNFSQHERQTLEKLAEAVDDRIGALTESRRQARVNLTDSSSGPGFAELHNSLAPIREGVDASRLAITAIRSFLSLYTHVQEGGVVSSESLGQSFESAKDGARQSEELLDEIAMAAFDCEDYTVALESLTAPPTSTRLLAVITAAQDLARHSTSRVGGAPLPDVSIDPVLYTSRPLAVGLLATSLSTVAARLVDMPGRAGIQMGLEDRGATVELVISAEGLSESTVTDIAEELSQQLGIDPTVEIRSTDGFLRLAFKVLETSEARASEG